MSMRNPSSFGVGEQLFSPRFILTPTDVAGWDRASVLGDRDDRPSFRPTFEAPSATSAAVPDGLVVAKALAALVDSAQWGGCRLQPISFGRASVSRIGVGSPLHAVATVRYRSRSAQACFLTLAIEVRSGSRRVAEFEVCVEVLAPTYWHPELAA